MNCELLKVQLHPEQLCFKRNLILHDRRFYSHICQFSLSLSVCLSICFDFPISSATGVLRAGWTALLQVP